MAEKPMISLKTNDLLLAVHAGTGKIKDIFDRTIGAKRGVEDEYPPENASKMLTPVSRSGSGKNPIAVFMRIQEQDPKMIKIKYSVNNIINGTGAGAEVIALTCIMPTPPKFATIGPYFRDVSIKELERIVSSKAN